MNDRDDIRYLHRGEIDTGSWDRCVRESPNGWLYARAFFLDALGDWDALVTPEYQYILPLPKKKKFGLPYTYVPPFTGQLGIIGPQPVHATNQDRGQQVFEENCARCHNAPEGFSSNISGTVAMHMRVRASLSDADYKALRKFLNP